MTSLAKPPALARPCSGSLRARCLSDRNICRAFAVMSLPGKAQKLPPKSRGEHGGVDSGVGGQSWPGPSEVGLRGVRACKCSSAASHVQAPNPSIPPRCASTVSSDSRGPGHAGRVGTCRGTFVSPDLRSLAPNPTSPRGPLTRPGSAGVLSSLSSSVEP